MDAISMTVTNRRGCGRAVKFLRKLVGYEGDECVLWPFSMLRTGYGNFGHEGKLYRAHIFICELAHGTRPSAEHCAAHSCHNRACVNPRHLSWKTKSENMLDKRENGTDRMLQGRRGFFLTPDAVAEIRQKLGFETVTSLAVRFGVSRSTINQIAAGKIWREGSRAYRFYERGGPIRALTQGD